MVNHMMSASSSCRMKFWIVDSGATCYMCNDVKLFVELRLRWHRQVVKRVEANYTRFCMCLYNLLIVSKAVETGKAVEFNKTSYQILDTNRKPITVLPKLSDGTSTN